MFSNFFKTFGNCFKIPELKSRIIFTLSLLAVCRLLAYIRIPGLNGAALSHYFNTQSGNTNGLLGMYNTFAGGAYENCAVGSLGIMPYISATIIIQLLQAVWPSLSKLAREENGRTKIVQYGRYLTVLLCIGQGAYFANNWLNPGQAFGSGFTDQLVLIQNHWIYFIDAVTVMTAGTMLLMWLGEQITERGIGNGVSLVITVGILARLPNAYNGLQNMFFPSSGEPTHSWLGTGLLLVILLFVVVGGVIAITQAQRKIPVQYASRMIGQKMYQGGNNFMPLRVNYAGVMPIIFASSILMFPQPVLSWLAAHISAPFLQEKIRALATYMNYGSWMYMLIYSLMILFFSYFWVATQFNEIQIADDLKKNGGYIPGVRPGQATAEYLHKTMSRITLAGALFLTLIAAMPIVLSKKLDIDQNVAGFFGGTSVLIAVGVLLDTMRQIESHLMMRNYDGFLKKGRVRGRF